MNSLDRPAFTGAVLCGLALFACGEAFSSGPDGTGGSGATSTGTISSSTTTTTDTVTTATTSTAGSGGTGQSTSGGGTQPAGGGGQGSGSGGNGVENPGCIALPSGEGGAVPGCDGISLSTNSAVVGTPLVVELCQTLDCGLGVEQPGQPQQPVVSSATLEDDCFTWIVEEFVAGSLNLNVCCGGDLYVSCPMVAFAETDAH